MIKLKQILHHKLLIKMQVKLRFKKQLINKQLKHNLLKLKNLKKIKLNNNQQHQHRLNKKDFYDRIK